MSKLLLVPSAIQLGTFISPIVVLSWETNKQDGFPARKKLCYCTDEFGDTVLVVTGAGGLCKRANDGARFHPFNAVPKPMLGAVVVSSFQVLCGVTAKSFGMPSLGRLSDT